jgi:hypothetical protein
VGQPLAEGNVDGLLRVFPGVFSWRHDNGECKGHFGDPLDYESESP